MLKILIYKGIRQYNGCFCSQGKHFSVLNAADFSIDEGSPNIFLHWVENCSQFRRLGHLLTSNMSHSP